MNQNQAVTASFWTRLNKHSTLVSKKRQKKILHIKSDLLPLTKTKRKVSPKPKQVTVW